MKILFVHLGREHLGIEHLSAVLKMAGHDTELAIDVCLFGKNDNIYYNPALRKFFNPAESIIKKAIDYNPDVICFTAYSTTLQWCFDIASRIKAIRNIPTIIGGIHITLIPEAALLSPHIDFGVHGEAESVITEIVENIGDEKRLKELPGVIYRDNGKCVVNPPPPLIRDIDSLPLLDKELFEHAINISDDYMTLTTRGCSFNCTYCCERFHKNLYKGEKARRVRSVDSLIDELSIMKERYNFKKVHFACSSFPHEKDWLADFAEKYSTQIRRPFWCFGHMNFFDHEYTSLMVKAGCRNVNFGLQSINEDTRRKLLGRTETNEKVRQALSICDSVGLGYDVDIMFHLPGETESDYEETVRFFSGFKCIHRIKLYNITLFPGTEFTANALKDGFINEEEYQSIIEGEIGDYFNVAMTLAKNPINPQVTNAYRNILRVLPMLPRRMNLFLLKKPCLSLLGKTPETVFKVIEMLRLLFKRDARLTFYIKRYLRHLHMHFTGRQRV